MTSFGALSDIRIIDLTQMLAGAFWDMMVAVPGRGVIHVVAQAMGGIMAITGPNANTPMKVGPGVGDILPGAMLAFGILAAVHHARRTGEGQFVDIAMTDAVLALCERTVYQYSIQGLTPV